MGLPETGYPPGIGPAPPGYTGGRLGERYLNAQQYRQYVQYANPGAPVYELFENRAQIPGVPAGMFRNDFSIMWPMKALQDKVQKQYEGDKLPAIIASHYPDGTWHYILAHFMFLNPFQW